METTTWYGMIIFFLSHCAFAKCEKRNNISTNFTNPPIYYKNSNWYAFSRCEQRKPSTRNATKPNTTENGFPSSEAAVRSTLACWFAVEAATTLLNKIIFAAADTLGNNYEWWRITRVHQPGCLLVHGIDEIPIIDCPIQGIYPVGRWLNTRLLFYTRQFVPVLAAVHAVAL